MLAKVHLANYQFVLVFRMRDFVDRPPLLVLERLTLFPVLELFTMGILGGLRLVDFPVDFAFLDIARWLVNPAVPTHWTTRIFFGRLRCPIFKIASILLPPWHLERLAIDVLVQVLINVARLVRPFVPSSQGNR